MHLVRNSYIYYSFLGESLELFTNEKCLQLVAELKPPGIKVVGIMSMVRNSVGENSYVSDEIILSRAGLRIRVGNTDAEGRMIMADPLCYVSTYFRSFCCKTKLQNCTDRVISNGRYLIFWEMALAHIHLSKI